jgi:hypothetical protein
MHGLLSAATKVVDFKFGTINPDSTLERNVFLPCGNPPGNFRSVRFARVGPFIEFAREQRTCTPQVRERLRAALVENHIQNWSFAPKPTHGIPPRQRTVHSLCRILCRFSQLRSWRPLDHGARGTFYWCRSGRESLLQELVPTHPPKASGTSGARSWPFTALSFPTEF